jgi:hypothetical protein
MSYDRRQAVSYAYFHWWKVCHDLYICTIKGAPGTKPGQPYIKVSPDTYFGGDPKQHARTAEAIVLGASDIEDCTHFISCCLGPMGGGLPITSEFPTGPYGKLSPKKLMDSLRLTHGLDILGTEKTRSTEIPADLQEGDLIAYWNGKEYQHCAMYLGNGNITCHTDCRWLAGWNIEGFSGWTFLHIR